MCDATRTDFHPDPRSIGAGLFPSFYAASRSTDQTAGLVVANMSRREAADERAQKWIRAQAGKGVSAKDLQAGAKCGDNVARRNLKHMELMGEIRKVHYGVWLVGNHDEPRKQVDKG